MTRRELIKSAVEGCRDRETMGRGDRLTGQTFAGSNELRGSMYVAEK